MPLDKIKEKGFEKCFFSHSTICELHTPCLENSQCKCRSSVQVVNFDKCKDKYCSETKTQSLKSVDALLLLSNCVYLIEIKGWREFIRNNKFSEENILKQTDKFELNKKYIDSFFLLKYLSDRTDFELTRIERDSFLIIDKCFVLVTDIDYNENALTYLSVGLNFLAESSSEIYFNSCYEATKNALINLDVEKQYGIRNPTKLILLTCKTFDNFITNHAS